MVTGGKNGFFKSTFCIPIFIYSSDCVLFHTGNQKKKYGIVGLLSRILCVGRAAVFGIIDVYDMGELVLCKEDGGG